MMPSNFYPITGFERYGISKEGEVFSIKSGKVLKPFISGSKRGEYLAVELFSNNIGTSCKIHRLMCSQFLPNDENKPCVNHKDGNKQNNRLDNLEWCTYSENLNHAYNTLGREGKCSESTKQKLREILKGRVLGKRVSGLAHGRTGKPPANAIKILKYDLEGNLIDSYPSVVSAAKSVSCSHQILGAAILTNSSNFKGFIWKRQN